MANDHSFGKEEQKTEKIFLEAPNGWMITAGRQSLLSGQFEKVIPLNKVFMLAAHIGAGGLPGSKDSIYPGVQGFYTVYSGPSILIGGRTLHFEIGADPQLYFAGALSFCYINGIIGFRYQDFRRGKTIIQLGYNPILYSGYKGGFDIPFSFLIGECF